MYTNTNFMSYQTQLSKTTTATTTGDSEGTGGASVVVDSDT